MGKHLKKFVISIVAFTTLLVSGMGMSNINAKADISDQDFAQVYDTAQDKLGSSYVYGAVGPKVFDCSGFTSYVYKKALNIQLPRTAQAQYNASKHVSAKNADKGDLVFFGSSKSNVYHVGLYVGNGKMIDAQNRGVITENVNAPWWNLVGYGKLA
ncbi:C40 family peptidase [Apilactobacillus xinyiensis]|uniref:NlpC/P60 family protein n=1 Tax=Apilactobacillus xinyiensis TaxID=2841032 RepID=A0ABT0I2I7_9LACO|nr:NlpC/P60 family protein [Apilactobacillus xinyiensis]MCK8624940.1 NlpC/P60 family protein [Apilactobacillus xinyiensis]MCL0312596.1 NlpC/P60 family protein [Apilactobacillus xinyiensis]MCL0318991.1 NlpC/P60 family protein [Apilactobacillus xinyiensis]